MADTDTYFIKEGYVENLDAHTFENEEKGTYWNKKRIQTASEFQWQVYKMALRLARERGARKVLDIGCGPPKKLAEIFPKGEFEITLVDQPTVKELADSILPEARFVPANLEEFVAEDLADFDLIICADVIEHLANPDACIEMIRSSLSKDGSAVISTPERDLLYGPDQTKSGHRSHVREWNAEEFQKLLESRGLQVDAVHILPQKRCRTRADWMEVIKKQFGRPSKFFSCQTMICSRPS